MHTKLIFPYSLNVLFPQISQKKDIINTTFPNTSKCSFFVLNNTSGY